MGDSPTAVSCSSCVLAVGKSGDEHGGISLTSRLVPISLNVADKSDHSSLSDARVERIESALDFEETLKIVRRLGSPILDRIGPLDARCSAPCNATGIGCHVVAVGCAWYLRRSCTSRSMVGHRWSHREIPASGADPLSCRGTRPRPLSAITPLTTSPARCSQSSWVSLSVGIREPRTTGGVVISQPVRRRHRPSVGYLAQRNGRLP